MTLTQAEIESVVARTYGNKRKEGNGHRDAVINTKTDIEHMLHGTGVTVNNADIEEVCRKEKRRKAWATVQAAVVLSPAAGALQLRPQCGKIYKARKI